MNIMKQLFRQPIRLVAVLLLLAVGSTFFSLGFGMYLSAQETAAAIQQHFVTIGVPTTETVTEEVEMEGGMTAWMERSLFGRAAARYLQEQAETSAAVKGAYRLQYTNAYSSRIFPTPSAREDGRYTQLLDAPYYGAMFEVTLTEVESVPKGQLTVEATGQVERVISLHPDYTHHEKLNISCIFRSQAELEAADLKVGGRYLVYASRYYDADLALRTRLVSSIGTFISGVDVSVNEIDWDNISYDMSSYAGRPGADEDVAHYWDEERGFGSTLSQTDLDSVNAGSVTAQNSVADNDYHPIINGEESQYTSAELRGRPTIVPLEGSVEDFLATPEGELWARTLRELEIQYHSVPVLGTDLLESIYPFHQNENFVTQGRTFSLEDYKKGNKVCVISETLAAASGLAVGDTVDLSFFVVVGEGDGIRAGIEAPMAQGYNELLGFTDGPEQYEIIGIYRQSNIWDNAPFSVTPNTVFVPNASLNQPTYTGDNGIYYTLVIENGHIDEVKALMAAGGYPEDIMYYFDRGYESLADTLAEFQSSARTLFIAACVTWVAALAVYLALFVFHQRRNAGLMLSLGAGKRRTMGFVWSISMLPALAAVAVGALAGTALMGTALRAVFSTMEEVLSGAFSGAAAQSVELQNILVVLPWGAALAAALQAAAFALAAALSAWAIASRKPLANIKGTRR